jgi:hypothetical protein
MIVHLSDDAIALLWWWPWGWRVDIVTATRRVVGSLWRLQLDAVLLAEVTLIASVVCVV